jgi:putative N6-adenine-specific DNA methylase
VATFQVKSPDDVYTAIKKLKLEEFITADKTFSIDTTVYSETINHSRYVTYKAKDAIVDYFSEKYGKRPSVSVANPDIYFNLHISHTTCTLSLDSSGAPLFKRGYRVAQTEAPINEVLAAGLLMLSGWKGQCDFIEPMCGSGTIAIEAAMIALNMAPGLFRKEFAFERWADFDRDMFDEIYNDDSLEREFKHKIYASDVSAKAIGIANANIKSAGLGRYIETKVMDIAEMPVQEKPIHSVFNPPYGERLSDFSIKELYSTIGTTLKHKFPGSNAWIISSSMLGFDNIGLKPTKKMQLINGDLKCDFRGYTIFSGKMKEFKRR